jgi:Protein of unknown function (DUF998)
MKSAGTLKVTPRERGIAMTNNSSQIDLTLLNAGIIAGPFFIVVALLQAFTREGFDLVRHPASLLSLGDWGWIQIANFALTGFLFIALAIGLRRVLTWGIGSRWVSRLLIIVGVAMIGGGILADPGLDFPPGAPEGVPEEMSWHAAVHGFAPVFGFLALIAALFILARRFGSQGQRPLMWVTIIVGLLTFVLSSLPSFTGDWETGRFNFLPLWAGVILSYVYTSFVVTKLKKELSKKGNM